MDKQDIRKALEQTGGKEEIFKGLEKFKANIAFLRSNRSSLMEKYANRWVAVQDEKIVASSKSQEGLKATLKRRRIDMEGICMEFLDPIPRRQIFVCTQARVSLAFSYT